MKVLTTRRHRSITLLSVSLFLLACLATLQISPAQDRDRADEIVANLAGGRVIVHVARDKIVFAAIDQPVEPSSIPPRVLSIDRTHIGVLLGASEWRSPADPKPVRLDKDFPQLSGKNPHYAVNPDEVAPDLDVIGVAFLERLRPLVSQLHHKIEFKPEEPIFEVVLIGYAPDDYGPEIWTIEYRIQQEEIATRGDFWQTRILRPRFIQLYPPEKHAPKTLVEIRYPNTIQGPTLQQLIQGNDPELDNLSRGDPKFSKVMETIDRGQANKAVPEDATDFLRAALPLVSEKAKFILGTVTERGFDWVVPPDEPVEKAKEDKNKPPEAPTLRKKPNPNP
ncbi:MAG TPA: hypothetical protein VKH63_11145 [Candidatus Acidoferrum sp.]|nr:hypothetical protein [Candidatus Acidoferrum sp.]